MRITIGSFDYELTWRIDIRCQLRTRGPGHYLLHEATATCRVPLDVFNEQTGKRLAFKHLLDYLRTRAHPDAPELTVVLNDKNGRRKVYEQFVPWLFRDSAEREKHRAQIMLKDCDLSRSERNSIWSGFLDHLRPNKKKKKHSALNDQAQTADFSGLPPTEPEEKNQPHHSSGASL